MGIFSNSKDNEKNPRVCPVCGKPLGSYYSTYNCKSCQYDVHVKCYHAGYSMCKSCIKNKGGETYE